MEDEVETPARQIMLTNAELKALAYFAVGVGSEGSIGGKDVSNRLAFAGALRNGVLDPVGNSGYSIGTLQTDLGQHPEAAMQLVDAYQAWARTDHPDWVLTEAQRALSIDDLARNGRAIEAQEGRPLDATVKSRLDAFLVTEAGITFIHGRDVAQIVILMRPGGGLDQLQGTALYRNSSLDDQSKLATLVLKLENQAGQSYYPRIITGVNNGTISSAEDARDVVDNLLQNRSGPNRDGPDYIESGMSHALKGAAVFNSLHNSNPGNPLHGPWQNVLLNPLVNPTQTGQEAGRGNFGSEYLATKVLFLQKQAATDLIEVLDQGGAYGYSITNSRGQSRPQSTNLYASGNDFVVLDGRGVGKAYVGGDWSDVDRTNLIRVNNRDDTTDININLGGQVRQLLHIDPNATVLRPGNGAVAAAQDVVTEEQRSKPPISSHVPFSASKYDEGDLLFPHARRLADQPDHPAFDDYERIRTTVFASGYWSADESRNIAACLLKNLASDPGCKRLDGIVVGRPVGNSEVNVFGVYSPHGERGPHFTTMVAGNQAAREQARSNLEQFEQQVGAYVQQSFMQVTDPSRGGSHHAM